MAISFDFSALIDDQPLKFRGEVYHPYHFNCTACGVELDSDAREVKGRAGFAANDMNELYCLRCHDKMGIPICGACRRPIEERVVTALGKHWHVEVRHFVIYFRHSFTIIYFIDIICDWFFFSISYVPNVKNLSLDIVITRRKDSPIVKLTTTNYLEICALYAIKLSEVMVRSISIYILIILIISSNLQFKYFFYMFSFIFA